MKPLNHNFFELSASRKHLILTMILCYEVFILLKRSMTDDKIHTKLMHGTKQDT